MSRRLSGPVVAAVLATAALAGALLSFLIVGEDASPAVPLTRPGVATTASPEFDRRRSRASAKLPKAMSDALADAG